MRRTYTGGGRVRMAAGMLAALAQRLQETALWYREQGEL